MGVAGVGGVKEKEKEKDWENEKDFLEIKAVMGFVDDVIDDGFEIFQWKLWLMTTPVNRYIRDLL